MVLDCAFVEAVAQAHRGGMQVADRPGGALLDLCHCPLASCRPPNPALAVQLDCLNVRAGRGPRRRSCNSALRYGFGSTSPDGTIGAEGSGHGKPDALARPTRDALERSPSGEMGESLLGQRSSQLNDAPA